MPERNEDLLWLQGLYEAYLKEVELLELNRKPGAGYFGIKGGPADDPCHDRFAETLRAFFEEFAAVSPPSIIVREMIAYAICFPVDHPKPRTAYWMLIAVQSLTQPLIKLLNPQDAGALAELFEKSFRRSERMPVQIRLIKELKSAAKT